MNHPLRVAFFSFALLGCGHSVTKYNLGVSSGHRFAPRDLHAVVATNEGFFLSAGAGAFGLNLNDLWFSSDGRIWNLIGVFPGPKRQRHAMLKTNRGIHIIGGCDGPVCFDDEIIYSQGTMLIRKTPFSGGGFAYYQEKNGGGFVAGGHDSSGNKKLRDIYSLSPEGDWTRVGELSFEDTALGTFHKLNDKYYFINKKIWVSEDLVKWVQIADITVPFLSAEFIFNNNIYFVGGKSEGPHLNSIQRFDGIKLQQIPSNIESIMTPRRAMGAMWNGHRIVVVAGYTDRKFECKSMYQNLGKNDTAEKLENDCILNSRKYFNDVFVSEDAVNWSVY